MNNTKKEVIVISSMEDENKKIRVAPYCRVSTDSNDQANSFFAQINYYNEYIKNHSQEMILVDIYADEGISGASIEKREDFKRLIKDCMNKKIDRILVKSVTRFARNSLECIETIRTLSSCGVSVFFENDNIDTKNMNSEMILYIKSAFAQDEVLGASRRMATSIRMKMADGTYKLKNAPYGYRLDKNELVINEEEAKIVKKIFELYINGMGTYKIASILKKENQLDFRIEQIRYILNNEKYIGDSLNQKTYTPNSLPLKKRLNKGELPMYYYENNHEPIIEKEIYNLAQQIRKAKREKFFHGTEKKYFCFTNKIECRNCHQRYRSIERKDDVYWVCSKKRNFITDCNAIPFSTFSIKKCFIQMFNKLKDIKKFIIDDTISFLMILKNKENETNKEISEIDEEIFSLSEMIESYNELYNLSLIDEVSYVEKMNKASKSLDFLKSGRKKLIREDKDELIVEQLKELKKIVEEENYMIEFNLELFNRMVDKIFVETDRTLTFRLIGDLNLNMEVGE